MVEENELQEIKKQVKIIYLFVRLIVILLIIFLVVSLALPLLSFT